jgi:hypothetical protein
MVASPQVWLMEVHGSIYPTAFRGGNDHSSNRGHRTQTVRKKRYLIIAFKLGYNGVYLG